ncbi:MAG: CehA/McbA family metallohydrolase [bacterium]|nr:CehA/McbA family metallohydrolase [bacterium]
MLPCIALLACGVAHAEIIVFADAFSNGWSLNTGTITNGYAHSGTRSIYNINFYITANNSAGTANGSHLTLEAYLRFDTSGVYSNSRLHRVNIALENPASPGTLTAYEFKPANSIIRVDGVRDSAGTIDFPADMAWHKLEIELASNTGAPFTPSKIGTISFVTINWGTPPDQTFMFADDIRLVGVAPTNAVLSVAPRTLDFGAATDLLTYQVTNAGIGTLAWTNTVGSGGAWLAVAPFAGTQTATITATVNHAALAYGSYTGRIDVTANGDVPLLAVNVYARKSPPMLAVAPLALDFSTNFGLRTVSVWNGGDGVLTCNVAALDAWITSAIPAQVTLTTSVQQIAVAINRGALAPSNMYAGRVLFTPSVGGVVTVTVAVSTWPPAANGNGYLHIAVAPLTAPSALMPARLILRDETRGLFVQQFYSEDGFDTNRWGYTAWPVYKMFEGVHHPRKFRTYTLPAGTYTITAGRGMTWYPTTTQQLVSIGATTDVTMLLQRLVDTEARGWYSGEAHLHAMHGVPEVPLAWITSNQFMLWGESAGINWLAPDQEYPGAGQTNLAGMQAQYLPMSNATFQCWMGGERPKSILGHLAEILPSQNPFSVLDDPPYYLGCEQVRRQGGITFPVHADRQFGAVPFYYNNFYKDYPLSALLGPSFDAWSVASNNERGFNPRQLGWWYALLDRGARLAAMADSDYGFDVWTGGMNMIGNWITFVNISGQVFSVDNICRAIREGRTVASSGPLLFFSIDGAGPGDTLAPGAHTARIEAYQAFHPWTLDACTIANTTTPMRLKLIELVRNGTQLAKWDNLNVAATTLYYAINETDTSAYYTVHVRATDGDTIAAIASPIFFDARPNRQPPLQTTIEGRVYDAFTGDHKPAVVEVSRFGTVLASFTSSTAGFFRLQMPLDADVCVKPLAADAGPGWLPGHRVMDHEQAFSNLTTMSRTTLGSDPGSYAANRTTALGALDQMIAIVNTMRWEFPLKYQFRNSYVLMDLTGDYAFSSAQILSSPALLATWTNAMCAMLLLDKYQVAPGDTINYAALFRTEGTNAALSSCYVKLNCWNPDRPSSFTTWGYNAYEKNSGAVALGQGYYAYFGSMTVPAFATNCYQGPGVVVDMYTRPGAIRATEISLFLNVGASKRGLLVSTSLPQLPFYWPNHLQTGLGPANLGQGQDSWLTHYNDYADLSILVNGALAICPSNDMAMCADADDAHFYDWAYYYSMGATAHTTIRPQPVIEFPLLAPVVVNPFVAGFSNAPLAVAPMAPADGTVCMLGEALPLQCDYAVLGRAVSNVRFTVMGPGGTTQLDSGYEFARVFSATTVSGSYTWSATVTAADGASATSASRTFQVVPEPTLAGAMLGVTTLSCIWLKRACCTF